MRIRSTAWEPAPRTPDDPQWRIKADQLAERLATQRTTIITGAGISTASGIPDYRGPDSVRRTPMSVQQFLSTPEFRRHYWARNHLGWRYMDAARPSSTHHQITELQRAGLVSGVITQNVDMLHLKAGTRFVIDLHGIYGAVVCLECGAKISRYQLHHTLELTNPGFSTRMHSRGAIEVAPDADAVIDHSHDFTMVGCATCGGILKPDIVYFGEQVPPNRVAEAYRLIDASTAILVAGSSLTVMSGLRFVTYAAKQSLPVFIVNRGETRGDGYAELKIDHNVDDVFNRLGSALVNSAEPILSTWSQGSV